MLIGSRILIPLDKNSVITFGKQKTSYRLALKILVECQGLLGKRIANARLARAHEHARRLRSSNYPRREERIEMAQGPNVATNFATSAMPVQVGYPSFLPKASASFPSVQYRVPT